MSTPPLSQATGTEHSEILIKDVVQRVKCELSDAFDEKTRRPEYVWLAGWTAHADLSLSINDNAGISPNGSFTDFHRSTPNLDAGPINYPVTAANSAARSMVPQLFAISAGANLSGQAVRTETVSFTVALDELKAWRQDVERREAGYPPEKRTCNFPESTGLTGNLGLKEWVDSAFYPAGTGDLKAGIHKSEWKDFYIPDVNGPKAFDYDAVLRRRLAGARIESGAPTLGAEADRTLPRGPAPLPPYTKEEYSHAAVWQGELKNLQQAIGSYTSSIASSSEKLHSTILSISAKLDDNKKYRSVMSAALMQKYNRVVDRMEDVRKTVRKCERYKKNIDTAYTLSYSILPSIYQINLNPSSTPSPAAGAVQAEPANEEEGKTAAPTKAGETKITNQCMQDKRPPLCPPQNEELYNDLKALMTDIETSSSSPDKLSYEKGAADCANKLVGLADFVGVYVNDIPNQVDPPVDSVLHSLQFVVSYGASVTPSWTLLQWKGPGQTGNFASASGIRTHSLQLALGPRSGAASISTDATRLIQNQTVKSLGN
jgi:hypothetical protein